MANREVRETLPPLPRSFRGVLDGREVGQPRATYAQASADIDEAIRLRGLGDFRGEPSRTYRWGAMNVATKAALWFRRKGDAEVEAMRINGHGFDAIVCEFKPR